MGKTVIGKLEEMLVLETEQDGQPTIIVWPKGLIVEISSEDDYPETMTDKDVEDAVKYLKNCDKKIINVSATKLT